MTATTSRKKQLAAEVREMREHGAKFAEIARALGISHSYASELYHDPTGEKGRLRKQGYAGRCAFCGNPTTGANGRANAPRLCIKCSARISQQARVWNRENVIKAIQAWAEDHGRPPLAMDWIRTGVTSSGVPHPGFSSVYRYKHSSSAPFASWADAVEAAGFPRPRVGHKTKGTGEHDYWSKLRAKAEKQRWRESLEEK